MLRLTAIALLLANLAYFAWTQGLLAGVGLAPSSQREPERLHAQVQPDTLRLLNGPQGGTVQTPAGVTDSAQAPQETTSCWQITGFTPVEADRLRTALGGTGLAPGLWQFSEVRSAGRWVVYMGRYNDEQMDKKKAELRELKIDFREVNLPSAGPGLALGTFSSEEAVRQALRDLGRKGVRSARTAVERPETVSITLRMPAITDAQRSVVAGLGNTLASKKLQPCE